MRSLGFEGPHVGGKHHFMIWRQHRLTIPSNDEYSVPQLKMMLREVEAITGRPVTLNAWIKLS